MKKKKAAGSKGILTSLFEHIEKIGLAMALLLGLFIVFRGFSQRQGIPSDKSPESLQRAIQQADAHINGFEWDRDYRAQREQDRDLLERANETLRAVSVASYGTKQVMKPPYHPPRTTRTDPVLFGATDLQAKSGFGFIASSGGSSRRSQFNEGFSSGSGTPYGGTSEENKGRAIPQTAYSGGTDRMGGYGGSDGMKGTHFVVVTGLVPLRKQVKEYLDRFKTADDFRIDRDLPLYREWILERAELQGNAKELKWERVVVTRERQRRGGGGMRGGDQSSMMGMPSEDSVSPAVIDPRLTAPVPSIAGVRKLDELTRHEKIPTAREYMREMARNQRRGGPGRGGDWGGRDGGRRRGMPRDGGYPSPGGYPAPSPDMMPPGGPEGSGRPPGGNRVGRTMEAPSRSMALQALAQSPLRERDIARLPENLMFRYFDFSVRPGKSYQYRLRLILDDPNASRFYDPPPASALDDTVLARVNQVKKGQSNRETEFSQPSNVVRVMDGQFLLAGPIGKAALESTIPGLHYGYGRALTPHTSKVMAVNFDSEKGAELPLEMDVVPGSMAYGSGAVEPVLRWKNWLDPKENKKIRVDTQIVDIRGGESYKLADLTKPGEILAWDDALNQLVLLRELDDEREFQTFVFPEDEQGQQGGFGGPERGGNGLQGGRGGARGARGGDGNRGNRGGR